MKLYNHYWPDGSYDIAVIACTDTNLITLVNGTMWNKQNVFFLSQSDLWKTGLWTSFGNTLPNLFCFYFPFNVYICWYTIKSISK